MSKARETTQASFDTVGCFIPLPQL